MLIQNAKPSRLVLVRMNPGDDLLRSLRAAVEKEEIGSGLILSGVGSLTRYRMHVVETTKLPPGDVFFEGEGPWDILQITGIIINGRVHAHITISNTEKAMGGHLEEGCRALTFCIAVIAETPEADYTDWDRLGAL